MSYHILGVGALGSLVASQIRSTQPQAQIKLLLRSSKFTRDWIGASRARAKKTQGRQQAIEGAAKHDRVVLDLDRSGKRQEPQEQHGNFDVEWVSSLASTRSEAAPHHKRKQPSGEFGRAIDLPVSALPISTLIITTKAPHVLPSIALLRQRLSANSTIVLLQDGMGILDQVVDAFFSNTSTRPSFVLGLSTQSVFRSFSSAIPRVHWRGTAKETLSYGVIPSRSVTDVLRSQFSLTEHPMLNPQYDTQPNIEDHLPPLTPATTSLCNTLTTLQACTDLQPTWLSLPQFQTQQLQRLTAVSCINPLSAIGDSLNGHLYGSNHFSTIARQLCQEASAAFFAQQNALGAQEMFDERHPLSARMLYGETLNTLRRAPQDISSTLTDIRHQSERTEIDYMNGYISRLGKHFGIPTPTHDLMVSLVDMRLEQARIGMSDERRHY